MTSIQELTLDLEECERLLKTSTRGRIIALLEKEKNILKSSISSALGTDKPTTQSNATQNAPSGTNYKPIKNFGWDGSSSKTTKIYVNLKGVGKHDTAKMFSHFDTRSLEVKVDDFNNCNYVFSINGLLADIVPEQCSIKAKDDDIIVTLKKKEEKVWRHLKKCDQEAEDKKKKKEADELKANNDDPSASMMNLMKKMYDEGDDEMKRTIAKAWTESREKQNSGDGGLGGGMGGMPGF